MSNPNPKAQVIDLSDLLPPAPPKVRAKPRRWKATALIVCIREVRCSNCGDTHTDANPYLLIREELFIGSEAMGSIRETSHPLNLPATLGDLPIDYRTVDIGATPVCLSCLEEETTDLHKIFIRQHAAESRKERDSFLLQDLRKEPTPGENE